MNHALEMMSGPVIGITVLDKTGSSTPAPDSRARRTLRLTARVDTGGTPDEPAYGFTLDDGRQTAVTAPP
jgi:hypothetical protein